MMSIQGNSPTTTNVMLKKKNITYSFISCNSLQKSHRWVNTLNSNDVADRIIDAVRKNEKLALIPWYFSFMLAFKWIFPWGCTSGFLRRLVPDATPQHVLATPISTPNISTQNEMELNHNNFNNNNNNVNNNNNGSSKETTLIKRMVAVDGERVL